MPSSESLDTGKKLLQNASEKSVIYHTNLHATIRLLSDFISQEPVKASAVVIAPNTGNDDTYNERAIEEAIQEVDDNLRQDTYSFRVRRGPLTWRRSRWVQGPIVLGLSPSGGS